MFNRKSITSFVQEVLLKKWGTYGSELIDMYSFDIETRNLIPRAFKSSVCVSLAFSSIMCAVEGTNTRTGERNETMDS